MFPRTRNLAAWAISLAGVLSSLGCSSLTEPSEIVVVAEELPTRPAPAAAPVAGAPAPLDRGTGRPVVPSMEVPGAG